MSDTERLASLEQRVARLEAELLGSRPILLDVLGLVRAIHDNLLPDIGIRLDDVEKRLERIEEQLRRPGQNGI